MSGLLTLPSACEMLRRLREVDDNPYYEGRFYPRILQLAGLQVSAEQLVISLTLAMHNHTDGMPKEIASSEYQRLPAFIRALIDDDRIFEATKEYFDREMAALT